MNNDDIVARLILHCLLEHEAANEIEWLRAERDEARRGSKENTNG